MTVYRYVDGRYSRFAEHGWMECNNPQQNKEHMIITDLDDNEHDRILDYVDGMESDTQGIKAKLILSDRTDDDPEFISFVIPPGKGQFYRHQNKYYEIDSVLQSSGGLAVFASRTVDVPLLSLAIGQ